MNLIKSFVIASILLFTISCTPSKETLKSDIALLETRLSEQPDTLNVDVILKKIRLFFIGKRGK